MQLKPYEYFTISRGLEDHTDSTTYYVRAVIRNARTDALIVTLNLIDSGDGHRFTKEWQVPGDPSGLGFYVSIQTSVYTDSGYTTKASNYGDKLDTYLVAERYIPQVSETFTKIDYKKITEMVVKAMGGRALKAQPMPKLEIPKPDFMPMREAILGLQQALVGKFESLAANLERWLDAAEARELATRKTTEQIADTTKAARELAQLVRQLYEQGAKLGETVTGIRAHFKELEALKRFSLEDVEGVKGAVRELAETIKKLEKLSDRPFMVQLPVSSMQAGVGRPKVPSYRRVE